MHSLQSAEQKFVKQVMSTCETGGESGIPLTGVLSLLHTAEEVQTQPVSAPKRTEQQRTETEERDGRIQKLPIEGTQGKMVGMERKKRLEIELI